MGDIFDSGWGGVNMVVELAKQGVAVIVHIKNSFAGYSNDELEQKLRGMPGGSFLEMRCVVDSITLIALAAKYDSVKTCFFCAPEGAAPTTPGEPYITSQPPNAAHKHMLTNIEEKQQGGGRAADVRDVQEKGVSHLHW